MAVIYRYCPASVSWPTSDWVIATDSIAELTMPDYEDMLPNETIWFVPGTIEE